MVNILLKYSQKQWPLHSFFSRSIMICRQDTLSPWRYLWYHIQGKTSWQRKNGKWISPRSKCKWVLPNIFLLHEEADKQKRELSERLQERTLFFQRVIAEKWATRKPRDFSSIIMCKRTWHQNSSCIDLG